MGLAAMVWALVAYDEARLNGRRWWLPGLLGALATLLHPWNGELLIFLILAAEAVLLALGRYRRDHLRLTVATVIATGVPILYLAILDKADLNWNLAQAASKHAFPFVGILIAVAAAAAAGARRVPHAAGHLPGCRHPQLAGGRLRDLPPVRDEPRRGAPACLPGDHNPARRAGGGGTAAARLATPASPGAGRRRRRSALFTIPATVEELKIAQRSGGADAGKRELHPARRERGAQLPGQ